MRKNYSRAIFLCLISSSALIISGCSNGNLFGKLNKSGDSGNVAALSADAENALRSSNYDQALELYQRILNQDPNNAKALYGAAAAQIGTSGINVGTIIANISNKNTVSASATSLSGIVAQSRSSIHSSSVDPSSLLSGIDLAALNRNIDSPICRLKRIVVGNTDGSIKSNDVDTLVNLAILSALRAVVRPLYNNNNGELLDIRNTSGNYDVTVNSSAINTFCADTNNTTFVETIAKDITAAYTLISKVIDILGLTDSSLVKDLKQDIADAANKILGSNGQTSPLPSNCLTILQNANIQLNNSTVLTEVPSGC